MYCGHRLRVLIQKFNTTPNTHGESPLSNRQGIKNCPIILLGLKYGIRHMVFYRTSMPSYYDIWSSLGRMYCNIIYGRNTIHSIFGMSYRITVYRIFVGGLRLCAYARKCVHTCGRVAITSTYVVVFHCFTKSYSFSYS